MKRLILALACLLIATPAFALDLSDTLEKVPNLKQGIAYSISDSKINYLSTIAVAGYDKATLELGYAGSAKNTGDKIVGVISYEVANLKDMGVDMPILDMVELNLGVYAGLGRINVDNDNIGEFDWGLSATLLDVKF